jgi:hypothetical protein
MSTSALRNTTLCGHCAYTASVCSTNSVDTQAPGTVASSCTAAGQPLAAAAKMTNCVGDAVWVMQGVTPVYGRGMMPHQQHQ